jgi:transposase
LPCADIASAIGKTEKAVFNWFGRQKRGGVVTRSTWRDSHNERQRPKIDYIAEYVSQGYSIAACAQALNIPTPTAYDYWRKIVREVGDQAA